MSEAAARHLEIDPDEVQVGVRPMGDGFGRVQGEVFIYDNVPGGAGYARAIQDSLGNDHSVGVWRWVGIVPITAAVEPAITASLVTGTSQSTTCWTAN